MLTDESKCSWRANSAPGLNPFVSALCFLIKNVVSRYDSESVFFEYTLPFNSQPCGDTQKAAALFSM